MDSPNSSMEDDLRKLNYECNYHIYKISSLKDTNFKSQSDRNKIVLWVRKLQRADLEYDDLLLRNQFMYHLLSCVRNKELRPPFNENPPTEPIGKLRHLLPSSGKGANTDWIDDLEKADSSIPDIYRKSPDGGAFLSQQPIPKCGAFCYLAIVSKSINGNE